MIVAEFPVPLAFFPGSLGPTEMLIILAVAVLLFGKRLPEVGRSLGKGIVEFKKGVRGIEDEIDDASSGRARVASSYQAADDTEEATAPKFEPPAAEPATDGPESKQESAEA